MSHSIPRQRATRPPAAFHPKQENEPVLVVAAARMTIEGQEPKLVAVALPLGLWLRMRPAA